MRALIIVLVRFWAVCASDPCVEHSRLEVGDRSVQCGAASERCDRYLNNQWFKPVVGDSPQQIPTTPVPLNRCNAVYPVWLNGTYPDIEDGIVNMTACTTHSANDCGTTYQIQVKNCNTFYVFYLVYTDGCPERYCFGNGPCTSGATVTTASVTPSTRSSLKPTVIITAEASSPLTSTFKSTTSDNKDDATFDTVIIADDVATTDAAAIAGGVVGAIVGSAIVTSIVWFVIFKRKRLPSDNEEKMYEDLSPSRRENPYTDLSSSK